MYQFNSDQEVIDRALQLATDRLHNIQQAPTVDNDIEDWLRVRFAGTPDHEEFVVIFVTGMNRVLATETVGIGDSGQVTNDVKRIVRRAVELGAEGVYFAHNHPHRVDAEPSDADRQVTSSLAAALAFFEVKVAGAYVVAGKEVTRIDPDVERYAEARALILRARGNPIDALAKLMAKLAAK